MRIPLFVWPYRVGTKHAQRKGREGVPFWRAAVFGTIWREQCECDSVQDCVVYRYHGIYPEFTDDDGEVYPPYDPRVDCEHRLRPPHTHTKLFGSLMNAPLEGGLRLVLRSAREGLA